MSPSSPARAGLALAAAVLAVALLSSPAQAGDRDVSLDNTTDLVASPGEEATVEFPLSNDGNDDMNISLEADVAGEDWPVDLSSSEVHLEPGTTAYLGLGVDVPSGVDAGEEALVQLHVGVDGFLLGPFNFTLHVDPPPTSPRPALAVEGLELAPSHPDPGDEARVTFRAANDGDAQSDEGFARVLRDDRPVANLTLGPLEPGESRRISSPSWTASEGAHQIRVVVAPGVDPASATLRYRVASSAPDPVLSGLSLAPTEPRGGQDVQPSAAVDNHGGPLEDGRVVWRLDGSLLENRPLPELDAGASVGLPGPDWTAQPGFHRLVTALVGPHGNTWDRQETTYVVPLDPEEGIALHAQDGEASGEPGAELAYDLVLANDGDETRKVTLEAEASHGRWPAHVDPSTVTLEPGAQTAVQVTIPLPEEAAPGRAPVHVTAEAADGSSADAAVDAVVEGGPDVSVTLLQDEGPLLAPGEAAVLALRVANDGDDPVTVRPTVEGLPRGWSTDVDRAALRLPAGAERTAHLQLRAPDGAEPGERTVTVAAEPVDDDAEGDAATATTRVQAQGAAAPDDAVAAAGAAAGLGLLAWALGPLRWRLAGLLAPLYSRLERSEVLDHEDRQAIYDRVQEEPGIHYSGLKEALGLGNGTLTYHLRVLQEHGFLVSQRDGPRKRFYAAGHADPGGEDRSTRDRVRDAVDRRPGASQAEIADELDVSRQVVHYHVQSLAEDGRVSLEDDGNRTRCYPSSSTGSAGTGAPDTAATG